ncbi:MAG: amino acid adenylation domain-containing protein, partial [bacterium]|nr:amino acid adenylation domain-containing protein [bacterium]
LLLNMHHIVSDGWSLEVLLRELANGYAALSQGKRPEWPELPIQYADFAVWQRRWIRGEVLEAQLAYWRRQLADVERLRLPTDRPRPAVPSHRGGVHRRVLPADRVAALETLGRRRGASRFMTLLAAFLALLHRTTGQRQVVVGAPVANRHHRETEGLVGCFVNALVLQGDFAGDPGFPRRGTNGGFPELLDRVREMALGAYAHQDLPFEKLVEALAPERDLRRNPLFQVSFGLLRDPASELDLPGLTVHRAELAHPAARFDLSGYLREADDGLRLELLYRTELFDATTIARLAGHFESLVRAAAAHPELRVGELPLWTPPQRHQVLAEWNDHRTRFSGAGCLHELFTAQAEITPEAVAVVEKRRAFSYGELDRLSERLARHLRGLGVGPETRVAIHLERSCELVIAILAVLKAGGAWVPLDPAHPAERLTFLLDDAGVTVLVTRVARTRAWGSSPGDDGGLKSLHPLPSAHLVLVLARAKARASGLVEPPQALPLPPLDKATSLACVFYTSGSTGRPKGVLVSHRALVNRLLWGQDAYPLSPSDRVLQLAASGFDFSIWEIFAPLAAGARLVLAAAGEERDPPGLAQTIARSGVTVVHFVPALLRAFLGAGESVACTSLKRVFCGGEALPAELAERFFAHLDAELWNQYGPTEAAIDATFQRCRPGSPVSIGRPIANAEVWVLDAHQRPVPIGVAGEIALGGAGLSRGYQRRPALTAERFVPHPFTAGARLYRTGDLGRRLADGTLEFLGRRDHQVKIRGIRIELGEIEALLREHPSVTDAVVVDRETSPNMRQLVSCFTSRDPAPASAELRAFLERFLPASMLPSAFAHLDELPRTAQGKVDRAAAGRSAPDHSGARVAPRTPLEELVAEIWTEVLEVTEIGAYDNFFALGGHSLLATRVTSRLRRACRVELPVRVLFERPTVAELAGALAATRGTPTELPPLKRTPFGATIPLSFAQERLWFLEQLEPGSLAYSMPSAWRLTGELDVGALEEAFRCIAERHEVLRTTFLSVDGEPRQVIAPKSDVALPIVDLRRSKIRPSAAGLGGGALSPGRESTRMPEIIPPGERVGVRGFLPRLLREEALRPFDLARGPLLRLTLLRLADRDHVLLLNLHHIISDGWSTGVLHRELATLYEAFASRRPSPLAPLPVRYVDFAVWQRQWLRGRLLEVQLDYWRRQLRGLPEPELPTDRPRPPEPSYRGAGCRLELGPELTRRLRELSRRSGGTLYMTLLAAFFTLLHRLTGERDLAAGTPIANRRHPEIEGLIGFFVNTLVMRGDLSSDPTFAELLDRVRETALDAYAHQDVPFEKLVEALAPERDLARHPLFQVLFTLQNAPRPAVELPGLTLGPLDFGVAAARFDQEWHLWEDAGSLHALVVYSRDLFDASTAARLGRHFATLLAAAAGDPERPLASLPLLESAERHQLEAEWNDTRTAVPAGTVLELWRAQAERTPDVVAVVCGASALSYRRLDREANRLARRLRELGVGPDVPVALSCERSPAMAVAVLGVLQAGGVCVPVDPAYPRERRAFLLADCGAPVLLRVARANDANGDAHHQPSFPGPQAVDVMKFALVCPGENQGQGVAPAEDGGISGHHQRPVEISQALPLPPLGMRVFPENLVYLLYTSGSTGRPKGVAMRHGALSNLILWQRRRSRPGARTLQFASLSFDVSFQEILATWTSGGTLVLIPEALRRDPEALLAYLATTGVERLFLPFVALAQLAEAADRQGTLPRTLREVITAGEALQATPAIRRLFARLGHAGLDNQYGPSETHVVTAHPLAGAPRAWPALPPIGRPVANARIHLLDA